jgi:hypothetical protein
MYYRDEDKSMKGLEESPLFTADEGTWVGDIVGLKYLEQSRDLSLNNRISAGEGENLLAGSHLQTSGNNQHTKNPVYQLPTSMFSPNIGRFPQPDTSITQNLHIPLHSIE